MNYTMTRMLQMIERAKGRCPELAKIEIIRPRSPFTVERPNANTLAYDPVAIGKLSEIELINEIVEAANEYVAPGTESKTARKNLPEMHVSDVELLKRIEPVLSALLSDGKDRPGRERLATLLWDVRWRLRHASGIDAVREENAK